MTLTKRPTVVFYYDISCPYAYIASTRIESLAARTNANLIWSPVLLGAIYRATSAPQGAAGSASDVFNPTRKAIASSSFQRTLRRYNIPLRRATDEHWKTVDALRLLYRYGGEERVALTKALFKAYWVDGERIDQKDVLADVARRSGSPGAQGLTERDLDTDGEEDARRNLEIATAEIIERGSPGVPGFWIPEEEWVDGFGQKRRGRLYWGQDRMHFVEAVLTALGNGVAFDQVRSIQTLIPRVTRDPLPHVRETKARLEFFFDFSSPWGYLGWTQLQRIQNEYGSRLEIEMKPFLLGALFKEIGAPMVPLLTLSDQKRNYARQDQQDWVRWWNAVAKQQSHTVDPEPVPFVFPDIFPIRSPTLLRIALVEPKAIPPLYRACWARNLDVSDDAILARVLSEAGLDARNLIPESSTPRIRDLLRARTREAMDGGICGVPSYRVSHQTAHGTWTAPGDVVWGQDELAIVEDMVNGWEPWDQDGSDGGAGGGGLVAEVGEEHRRTGKTRL